MPYEYLKHIKAQNSKLRPEAGTYALLLYNSSIKNITIGKLGKFRFNTGYYIYIGSAMGPGGIRSRVNRHIKRKKAKRWHIDFLRASAELIEIVCSYGTDREECLWASGFHESVKYYSYPVKGFGSSDCKCCSHLIYSPKKPSFKDLMDENYLI